MRPVLEPPAAPYTPEARATGDVVLRAAVAAGLALLVCASVFAARAPVPPASADEGRALPYEAATPFETAEWTGAEDGGEGLRVAARGANGAVATVRGGEAWDDYTVRARLRWEGGRAVAVHVRDAGPADYVACVLDGRTARIDEARGGVVRTLAAEPAPEYARRAFDAVIVADGRRVGFAVDGRTLVTAPVRRRSGTVALSAWGARWDEASLSADFVRVEPAIAALAPVAPGPAGSPPHEDTEPGE